MAVRNPNSCTARLLAEALDGLDHGLDTLALDLREPVPGGRVDRAQLLAERARAAEPGHQAIEDQLILAGT